MGTPLRDSGLFELTVLGVHLKSEGYPNVTYRVRALLGSTRIHACEVNYPFLEDPGQVKKSDRWFSKRRKLLTVFRIFYAHLNVFIRYFRVGLRRPAYIPYPAVGLLFLFSFIPRVLRPKVIAIDAFISMYDTVVEDRKLMRIDGFTSRVLLWLESRAYSIADIVVADTDFNAAYLKRTFLSLQTTPVITLPLSIDESCFKFDAYQVAHSVCSVLFMGTFVPLQGVDTIARAAILLASRSDIRFVLVGDGQVAPLVRMILSQHPCQNIKWITEWQSKEQIKSHIVNSDICLGIFGTTTKTQRVWPFKNYHYMAVGRPVITGDTDFARQLAGKGADTTPFLTVPCGDPAALAKAIGELAAAPTSRIALSLASRQLFAKSLSTLRSVDEIIDRMDQLRR